MLQPAARHWPLAASDPIQASEAKAPLAESRGVCMALWTRMGFDVSEAVLFNCPEYYRRTGSRGSVDVRAARFGSEQPTSALGSRPRPPGWAAHTGPTRAHCPPSVAAGRWGIEVRLERWNVPCCCGGLPGLPVQLVPARGRFKLAGARPDWGGLCPLGMALGQAARRAQDGGASRCWPVWAGAYVEASTEWEACESRRGSGVLTQQPRENGADPGGPGGRCRDGQGAPPTGGRF